MPQVGDILGPFRLIKFLGDGAYGTVYLAEPVVGVPIPVAVKIPKLPSSSHQDLRAQANVWAQASGHPNVVPILSADVYNGVFVIVSEYIADGSLRDRIDVAGGQGLPLDEVLSLIDGMLAGLEHLHARNIIHRDLKPDNVMLQRGLPRIADFGESKLLRTGQVGSFAGTPPYLPPEAFRNEMTCQSDLWSVGVISYELLTGQRPFHSGNVTQYCDMNCPAPSLPASIPSGVRRFVARSLEKKVSKRYQTATEMRAALRQAMAAPTNVAVRRSVPMQRFALLAACAGALVVGRWGLWPQHAGVGSQTAAPVVTGTVISKPDAIVRAQTAYSQGALYRKTDPDRALTHYHEAEQAAREAMVQAPNSPIPYKILGAVQLYETWLNRDSAAPRQEHAREAVQFYSEAQKRLEGGKDAEIDDALGTAYEQAGQTEEARRYYHKVLADAAPNSRFYTGAQQSLTRLDAQQTGGER